MTRDEIIPRIQEIPEGRTVFVHSFGSLLGPDTPDHIDGAIYPGNLELLNENPLYDVRLRNELDPIVRVPVDTVIPNTVSDHLMDEASKDAVA